MTHDIDMISRTEAEPMQVLVKRFDRRGARAEYNLLSALDRNPTTINAGADICAEAKSTILAQANRIEELEAQRAEGMREAVSLATALHRRFYQAQAPQWAPLEDIAGVISQIDNMTAGLADRIEELEAAMNEMEENLITIYWVGYEDGKDARERRG